MRRRDVYGRASCAWYGLPEGRREAERRRPSRMGGAAVYSTRDHVRRGAEPNRARFERRRPVARSGVEMNEVIHLIFGDGTALCRPGWRPPRGITTFQANADP